MSSDGQHIVASLKIGKIIHSSDFGSTFTENTLPSNAEFKYLAMDGTGQINIAIANSAKEGAPSIMLHSDDFGRTWTQTSILHEEDLLSDVAMSADGKVAVLAVSNGALQVSSDFGITWKNTGSIVADWAYVACDSTGRKILAQTAAGEVHGSIDGGASFSVLPAQDHPWKLSPGSTEWLKFAEEDSASHEQIRSVLDVSTDSPTSLPSSKSPCASLIGPLSHLTNALLL
jgi:photosystem II stability/assembly factor-like uncharacterized protein